MTGKRSEVKYIKALRLYEHLVKNTYKCDLPSLVIGLLASKSGKSEIYWNKKEER